MCEFQVGDIVTVGPREIGLVVRVIDDGSELELGWPSYEVQLFSEAPPAGRRVILSRCQLEHVVCVTSPS